MEERKEKEEMKKQKQENRNNKIKNIMIIKEMKGKHMEREQHNAE